MKLGAFNTLFYDRDFEKALEAIKAQGCEAVEIGCGGFINKKHVDPSRLLADEKALKAFRAAVEKSGLFGARLGTLRSVAGSASGSSPVSGRMVRVESWRATATRAGATSGAIRASRAMRAVAAGSATVFAHPALLGMLHGTATGRPPFAHSWPVCAHWLPPRPEVRSWLHRWPPCAG